MVIVRRILSAACDILDFLGVLGLLLPPHFGNAAPPQGVEAARDSRGQGGDHRADPCDLLPDDPPGEARGHEKQCPPTGSSGGVAKGDFNGDGYGDLAVGVPFEGIGNKAGAGAVHVIYGSEDGLGTSPPPQVLHQDTPFVEGVAEAGDHFGSTLAAGDFNNDGYSDLAIGVPDEDDEVLSNNENTGMVNVIYGTPTGLNPSPAAPIPPDQLWSYSLFFSRGLPADSRFGAALVWGNFNGDDFGDLAIGIPGANVPLIFGLIAHGAGEVMVLYGKSETEGLALLGHQFVHQNGDTPASENVGDGAEENDQFGAVLAAGNFDGSVADDLVVGVPREDLSLFASDQGVVHVINGGINGLIPSLSVVFSQDSPGVRDIAEGGDRFGSSLAAGNFDGDDFDDLAIGVPREDLEKADGTVVSNVGGVNVLYGSDDGLSISGDQHFRQGVDFGLFDTQEGGDQFGFALAAGDFNGDLRDDLAVGVPFEDISQIAGAGVVHIISGSDGGLTGVGDQIFTQATGNRLNQGGDNFGYSLTAWNFGRTSRADLAIGVPGQDLFNSNGAIVQDAGAVIVFYSNPDVGRLSAINNQFWHQNIPGVSDPTTDEAGDQIEAGDQFGRALY